MTKNTDSVIISFASRGRENYNKALLRLKSSLQNKWHGDVALYSFDERNDGIIFLNGKMPNGCHTHQENPYQFKYGLIDIYREKGYKKIIWLDSSMYVCKNPIELFNSFAFGFHNLGHPLYKYINDTAIRNLQTTRGEIKEAEKYTTIQTWGGAFGFDFSFLEAHNIFNEIILQIKKGSFKEDETVKSADFIAHRHDQAVLSYLFYKHMVTLKPYGKIVTQQHAVEPFEYGKDFYFISKPI